MEQSNINASPIEESCSTRVRAYHSCCQTLVKRLHEGVLEEKERKRGKFGFTRSTDRMQYYTGLSKQTLHKMLSNNILPDPRTVEDRFRSNLVSEEDEIRIRPAVVELIRNKKTVTIDRLIATLRNEVGGWPWSRSTTWRALGRVGFHFDDKHKNYYDVVRENPQNMDLRARYLDNYFKHVSAGRPIFYMDESWINKNCKPSKCWHDGTLDTVEQAPPGKGPRWILIGAGSREGWVPNSFRMWKGTVKNEDYHTEMNSDVFRDWLHNYFLPNVPPNAVLVCDRASYHLIGTEDTMGVNAAGKKEDIIAWILAHNAIDPNTNLPYTEQHLRTLTKVILIAIARENKPVVRFQLFDWIKSWNEDHNTDIVVNLLPVAHPQLNPIEMLWNWIKTYVKTNNHEFSMPAIKRLTDERIEQLGQEYWTKACDKSHAFAIASFEADAMLLGDDEDVEDVESNDDFLILDNNDV
jgi:hypothetical protein